MLRRLEESGANALEALRICTILLQAARRYTHHHLLGREYMLKLNVEQYQEKDEETVDQLD